ncbi:hypothetical protein HDU85_000250 [Gaertneriomyces sp. JEL0708]|nr:hypothetical protein HDU85_000250 [Gaertneriomyces sp. JEL0708]
MLLSTSVYTSLLLFPVALPHIVLRLTEKLSLRSLRPWLLLPTSALLLLIPTIVKSDKYELNIFGTVWGVVLASRGVNFWTNVSKGAYSDGVVDYLERFFLQKGGKRGTVEKKLRHDTQEKLASAEGMIPAIRSRQRSRPGYRTFAVYLPLQYLTVNAIYYYFRRIHPAEEYPSLLLPMPSTKSIGQYYLQSYLYVFGCYVAMNILYYPFTMVLSYLTKSPVENIPMLHDRPFLATGLRDFWNRRWNLVMKGELKRGIYLHVLDLLTAKDEYQNAKRGGPVTWKIWVAGMSTFVYSGLLHAYIIYSFDGTWDWYQLGFFCMQGLGVTLELAMDFLLVRLFGKDTIQKWKRCLPGKIVGWIWTTGFLLWTSPMFLERFVEMRILDVDICPLLF